MPSLRSACVCLMVHDDHAFLGPVLRSFSRVESRLVYVSRVAWSGEPGDWERSVGVAEAEGATVVFGDWTSEEEHREFALTDAMERGHHFALIPDSDEIIEEELLDALLQIGEAGLAERVYVEMDTYWKDAEHVIRPREALTPCILVDLERARPVQLRQFVGGRALLLNSSYGVLHHLSYAGSDERIHRKISTWGHKDEVVAAWYERVWKGWDTEPTMTNLHPTHPQAYGFAERILLPDALIKVGFESSPRQEIPVPARFPSVSIVIPLCGGEADIRDCLDNLSVFPSLLHEVIVVDNGSTDMAPAIADDILKRLPNGRVIALGENQGFAKACNVGWLQAGGEIVVFLNSDTVVPRSGFIRLIETVMASGSIAASGPLSNNVGHFQRVPVTYTSLDSLEYFADEFAMRPAPDTDTDMLVGFCLAVRKACLHEVGGFDEGFGVGTFEDNDLCYRLRRAGYRLVIAGRSFVHHTGSQTLTRVVQDVESLLRINQARYLAKWRDDLELGFASHLSGMGPEPIQFNVQAKPERFWEQVALLKDKARISLCMIVRNEERVLGDCLHSAVPFFLETIVVDTGSDDRTVEIAEQAGAKVVSFPWTDSFSEARNVSLEHATGDWLFWMDADDTLPAQSGMQLLQAALSAPAEVMAFVVPVRFVDDLPSGGTQVDHVKLFRNAGAKFEGRIHEQILPELREIFPDGQVARLAGHVLHSGYDTSDEGQARKKLRDDKLLKLDLAERPGHPFVLFNLGMTAHYTGRHEEAIEWLRQCIEKSPANESHVRKAYTMLGTSYRISGKHETAKDVFEEGLLRVGEDPELHFALGHMSAERGDNESARKHYKACLSTDVSGFFTSMDHSILGYRTWHNLGGVELADGNYPGAAECYQKALDDAPDFLPSAFALFDAAKSKGDANTMYRMLDWVRNREGESNNWHSMRAKLG